MATIKVGPQFVDDGSGNLSLTNKNLTVAGTGTLTTTNLNVNGGNATVTSLAIGGAQLGANALNVNGDLKVVGNNSTAIVIDHPAGVITGSDYSSIQFTASNQGVDGYIGSEIKCFHTNGGINLGILALSTSDVERMRITSDGNVLIGTETDNGIPGAKLQVNGGISAVLPTSSAGLSAGSMWNDGGIVKIV